MSLISNKQKIKSFLVKHPVSNMIADTPYMRKISNHPPHIVDQNGESLSPSAFIPFCSFLGNWSLTGVHTNNFRVPVCNIFQEVILDGQLCYRADVNKLKEKVAWEKERQKIITSGFMFVLDYNEDRNVVLDLNDEIEEVKVHNKLMDSMILGDSSEKGDDKAMVYLETLGRNFELHVYSFETLPSL